MAELLHLLNVLGVKGALDFVVLLVQQLDLFLLELLVQFFNLGGTFLNGEISLAAVELFVSDELERLNRLLLSFVLEVHDLRDEPFDDFYFFQRVVDLSVFLLLLASDYCCCCLEGEVFGAEVTE